MFDFVEHLRHGLGIAHINILCAELVEKSRGDKHLPNGLVEFGGHEMIW